MRNSILFLVALALFAAASVARAIPAQAGPYTLDVRTDPAVIPVGRATLVVAVQDSSGKPVSGATIKAIAQMPGMPMGEREAQAAPDPSSPGVYRLPVQFAMDGVYQAKISIVGPQGAAVASVPLQTGQSTAGAAGSGGLPFGAIFWFGVPILLAILLIWRMRKTGQRVDMMPLFKGPVIGSLLLLAALVAIAAYAVNHWRRPGAITPIQAQVMQMEIPAPEGSAPVVLAKAELEPTSETVNYTGQAAGFVEQDVNPRVTGVIQWMPFYVGNRVHKGQVLARLDTSQLEPLVGQKTAAVQNAQRGVDVARADYQQAQATVGEAESELAQYQSAVEEAKASLQVAREDQDAAVAAVSSAQAGVANAQASVTAANADETYWRAEIGRIRNLFSANAVSKAEFESEQAQATKAEAALAQANQSVADAQAKLQAANAEVRARRAAVTAAVKKVAEANSQLMSHHAHVRMEEAATRSAHEKVSQSTTAVAGAQADLDAATAQRQYANIRSEVDGVITSRMISPGVLVGPGQAILKVAQISPIRLQANVSESDLSRIRVGARILVSDLDTGRKQIEARVTSVAPFVDPQSRTGMVEAVLPNRDGRFVPGEFVAMTISVGAFGDRLTVPTSAIQTSVLPSESAVNSSQTQQYVWVAEPMSGQVGQYTVHRVDVAVAGQAGDKTIIRSGLSEGDQVVVQGSPYLADGQMVTASTSAAATTSLAKTEMVRVDGSGFHPNSITFAPGQPHEIVFLRTTDNTCAKEVVFPSLNIRQKLPLNSAVTVKLPASFSSTLGFVCGMNMFRGEVIAR